MEGLFDKLWEYTDWANSAVLKALEGLGATAPETSLRLMSHIVNAQTNWLNRLNGDSGVAALWEVHELEKLSKLNSETLNGLKAAIDRYAGNYAHKVGYKNLSGVFFENSVSDILTQVLNHGTYHRAQIALDLREKGLDPVNTDYITFVRMR